MTSYGTTPRQNYNQNNTPTKNSYGDENNYNYNQMRSNDYQNQTHRSNRQTNDNPSQNDDYNNYGSQHQDNGSNQKSLTLEYGKTIKLLRNGDEFYKGHKMVINSRKYRYFDVFLDDVSDTMNANFGAVRSIHTPIHGHRVKSLNELEDGKTYVAAGGGRFVRLNYADISEGKKIPSRLPSLNRMPQDNNMQIPQYDANRNVLIYVYRNGDVLTAPAKILLYKNTLSSFDAVLNEITSKVKLLNGGVLKLFTMDGESVVSPSQLVSGNSYVAANKERFKRCEYFTPQDFGASPKLNRKIEHQDENVDEIKPLTKSNKHRFNSQPASYNSSNASASGKSNFSYSGKPYTGWYKENQRNNTNDLPPVNKQQRRANNGQQFTPQQQQNRNRNVDQDDGGIYKARNNQNDNARTIPDNRNMYVDMPADYRRANQIDDEDINGNRNNSNRNRQQNQVKSQQHNADNKQQNTNRQNGPSNSTSQHDRYNNNTNNLSMKLSTNQTGETTNARTPSPKADTTTPTASCTPQTTAQIEHFDKPVSEVEIEEDQKVQDIKNEVDVLAFNTVNINDLPSIESSLHTEENHNSGLIDKENLNEELSKSKSDINELNNSEIKSEFDYENEADAELAHRFKSLVIEPQENENNDEVDKESTKEAEEEAVEKEEESYQVEIRYHPNEEQEEYKENPVSKLAQEDNQVAQEVSKNEGEHFIAQLEEKLNDVKQESEEEVSRKQSRSFLDQKQSNSKPVSRIPSRTPSKPASVHSESNHSSRRASQFASRPVSEHSSKTASKIPSVVSSKSASKTNLNVEEILNVDHKENNESKSEQQSQQNLVENVQQEVAGFELKPENDEEKTENSFEVSVETQDREQQPIHEELKEQHHDVEEHLTLQQSEENQDPEILKITQI